MRALAGFPYTVHTVHAVHAVHDPQFLKTVFNESPNNLLQREEKLLFCHRYINSIPTCWSIVGGKRSIWTKDRFGVTTAIGSQANFPSTWLRVCARHPWRSIRDAARFRDG